MGSKSSAGPPAAAGPPAGSGGSSGSADRMIGTIGMLVLILFIVIAWREREAGPAGSATTTTTVTTTVTTAVTTATPATTAVEVAPPVVATAAPIAAAQAVALSGTVVDRTTAGGQYVLRIASHTDGVVQPVVVSEAVWVECVVDADYNGAFSPPCVTSK